MKWIVIIIQYYIYQYEILNNLFSSLYKWCSINNLLCIHIYEMTASKKIIENKTALFSAFYLHSCIQNMRKCIKTWENNSNIEIYYKSHVWSVNQDMFHFGKFSFQYYGHVEWPLLTMISTKYSANRPLLYRQHRKLSLFKLYWFQSFDNVVIIIILPKYTGLSHFGQFGILLCDVKNWLLAQRGCACNRRMFSAAWSETYWPWELGNATLSSWLSVWTCVKANGCTNTRWECVCLSIGQIVTCLSLCNLIFVYKWKHFCCEFFYLYNQLKNQFWEANLKIYVKQLWAKNFY